MEFLDGLRYMFNAVEDPKYLETMQKQIAEKIKIVKNLTEEIDVIDFIIVFQKMQAFKLMRLHKGFKERREHNETLYPNLQKILKQTELMMFYFGRVELEKIQKFDEIPLNNLKKEYQQQMETYQSLSDRMENRDIVVQFRAVQENHQKIVEMRDKMIESQLQKRNNLKMNLAAAIQRRNSAIVDIIVKAKRVNEILLQFSKEPEFCNKVEIQSSNVLTDARVVTFQSEEPGKAQLPNVRVFKVPPPTQLTDKPSDKLLSSALCEKFDFEVFHFKKAKFSSDVPHSSLASAQNNHKTLKQPPINLKSESASKGDSEITVDLVGGVSETLTLDEVTNQACIDLNDQPQSNDESLNCQKSQNSNENISAEIDVELNKPINSTYNIYCPLVTNTSENSNTKQVAENAALCKTLEMSSESDLEKNGETKKAKSSDESFWPKSFLELFSNNSHSNSHKDHAKKSFENVANDLPVLDFESETAQRLSKNDFDDDFNSNRYHSKPGDDHFL